MSESTIIVLALCGTLFGAFLIVWRMAVAMSGMSGANARSLERRERTWYDRMAALVEDRCAGSPAVTYAHAQERVAGARIGVDLEKAASGIEQQTIQRPADEEIGEPTDDPSLAMGV